MTTRHKNPHITIFAIAISLFFVTNHCYAQENINFGISLGPNYTSPYFPDYIEKIGFQGGVYSNISIVPIISVQIEIMIAHKKYEAKIKNINIKQSVTYLDFPVFMKFKIFKPISVYTGIQTGIRCNSTIQLPRETSNTIEIQKPDKFVFSPLSGIVIKPNKHLGIDIRYSIGLERSKEHIANLRGWQFLFFYEF